MGDWVKPSVGFCIETTVASSTTSMRMYCLEIEHEEGCVDAGKWEGWVQRMESGKLPGEVGGACHVE